MKNNTISLQIKDVIEHSKNIIIFSHVNPDGDTLGSMLALSQIIKDNFNKITTNVIIGLMPEIYKFLPNIEKCKLNTEIDKNKVYDLAISLDIAAKDRLVDMTQVFFNAKTKLNIDHHVTNNGYGDVNYIKPNASSTAEVLCELIKNLSLKINKDIATCLYTGILTDTGGFRFENTTANVFSCAAELLNYNINSTEIFRKCYEQKPKSMALLGAFAVSNAKFIENDRIAYSIITKEDMKKLHAKSDYTEGISEALRQINTTEVSMLLKESENQTTKVSLRSKKINVAKVAEVFGGGGHNFAAGCTIQKPPNVAVEKLLEVIRKELCQNKV